MNYALRTDRDVAVEPALPTLGPAGSSYTDPVFGTKITRVTDNEFSKSVGAPNRWWSTGSGGEQNTWNADSTAFIVQGYGGEWVPFGLSGKLPTPNNYHGLPIGGPCFSYTDPDILYGHKDGVSLMSYNLRTMQSTELARFPASSFGEVSPSANGRLVTYGNGGQDLGTHVYLWDGAKLRTLDTLTGKVDGVLLASSGITWGWGVHNVRLDKGGRFAVITTSPALGIKAGSPIVVWDIDNFSIRALESTFSGHKVGGFGKLINQDVEPDTTWDDMQYVIRSLDNPALRTNLIKPLITPKRLPEGLEKDSHLSWNNASQTSDEPVLVSAYRRMGDPDVWRALDNEIFLIATDGSGTVYRVCHHRTAYQNFWDGPHAVISPDGTKAVFTSNMGLSLGTGEDGEARRDVFRVDLAQAAPTPTPTPIPVPSPTPTPVPSPTPTPTPSPSIPIGSHVEVTGRVNVRSAPSTSSTIKRVAEVGEAGITTGAPQLDSASGNTFVPVDFTVNEDGFVAVQFLKVVEPPTPAPDPVPTPTPTPDPVPTPTPQPSPCQISAPASISVPRNGSGEINIHFENLTQPVAVNVSGSDGQVTVSPLSRVAQPPSSILAFKVRVKRQSRTITFTSSCGVVSVKVNVT